MVARSRHAKFAHVEHIFVEYDGPQLLLLKGDNDRAMLAHAIYHDGFMYPVVSCEVNDRIFENYLSGKIDLRYVFSAAPKGRRYISDLNLSGDMELKPLKSDCEAIYLPEHGIFSYVHMHKLKQEIERKESLVKFAIDGVWDAKDISRFNGKLSDTYTLLGITKILEEPRSVTSSMDLIYLRDSILERPWLGGGSYLSFYGAIKSDEVTSVTPLRVSGIEYHSPGFIEFACDSKTMAALLASVNHLIFRIEEISKKYTLLRNILRSEGMLRSDKNAEFASNEIEKITLRQAVELSNLLLLPAIDRLLIACNNNVSLFSKLVLSYYRRVKVLADFQVSGRVRPESEVKSESIA